MSTKTEATDDDNCISVQKPAHRIVAGDYVRIPGRAFDRVIRVAVQPDGRRQVRFREYQASLPADRVVDTY